MDLYASKWILSDEAQIKTLIDTLSNGVIPTDFDISDPPLRKAVKGFDNKFALEFVTKDGEPEPYQMQILNNRSVLGPIVGERIRIGEESVFLAPDSYTYEMSYRFRGNIVESDGRKYTGIKLSGFGWTLPIDRISGRIYLPPGSEVISAFCHTSIQLDSDCEIEWSNETIDIRDNGNGKQRGLSATIVWSEPAAIS